MDVIVTDVVAAADADVVGSGGEVTDDAEDMGVEELMDMLAAGVD